MPEENIVQLSRDPFARTTLVRRLVEAICGCDWCGINRKSEKLFEYGTENDNGRVYWHDGYFCSKGCHDSYHGI